MHESRQKMVKIFNWQQIMVFDVEGKALSYS